MGVAPLTLILQAIVGALAFPAEVLRLIAALKKTPQENHEALLVQMEAEASKFESTGRPSW